MINTSTIDLGIWMYDPQYGRFFSHERGEFFLEKRLNKLLLILLNNSGSIVKREDIIDYVWKEVQVNEENLTKGIFDLRKLFKQKGITAIKIETIRNIGYRLTVQEVFKKEKPIRRILLKFALYIFLILSFAILFIRAIRYDN